MPTSLVFSGVGWRVLWHGRPCPWVLRRCAAISPMPEYRYRRNLPHWRDDHVIYFVTWRLSSNQPELAPTERGLVGLRSGISIGSDTSLRRMW